MAPAEDTTAHWDYCIPSPDDIYSLSPFFLFTDHPTTPLNTTSRDLSGHHFGMSSMRGSSALLHSQSLDENSYDKYSASGYAPSTNGPTRRHQSQPLSSWSLPSSDSSARHFTPSSKFGDNLESLGLSGHVNSKSQAPFSSPARQSTLTGDLPPSHPDRDYMDHDGGVYHHLSPDPSENLLSPLPLSWPGSRLSMGALPGDIYHSGLMFPGALGPVNSSKDVSVTERDDDDFFVNHPFAQLLWGSPCSVDTDLDDESITSSTSSLSPEYPDTDLRHSSLESDEDEEFEDSRYYSQLSSPMHHDDHRYHIDQYPSHFDLYDETLSPLSLSCPDQHRLSSEPPLLQPASPPPPNSESLGLPLMSFPRNEQWSLYNTDDVSTRVPSSPSRRRSANLPLLNEDLFGLQEGSSSSLAMDDTTTTTEPQQRNFWLSLPGAETDDDLIPRELGSKNYVPDPTITVPTTPPSSSSGGLLLWDVDGGDLVRRRSPSPEDFYLDPTILAELPKSETGAEAQKIYELKQRTTGRESWEREKSRELSALLRLKLKLDETGSPSSIDTCSAKSNAAYLQTSSTDTTGRFTSYPTSNPAETASTVPGTSSAGLQDPDSSRIPPSVPESLPISTPNLPSARIRNNHTSASPTWNRTTHHKPAISSMDQLVANMVFHRQQEPLRKKPIRSRTWSPPAAGVPKSHPTPKSPLRQVLLPEEGADDETEEDEGSSPRLAQLVESPLPLSPLCLMETDLAPSLAHQ